jgi:hypothetical protein
MGAWLMNSDLDGFLTAYRERAKMPRGGVQMRRVMVVAAMLAAGCGAPTWQHKAGNSLRMNPGDTWTQEADYELLALASGKACGALESDSVKRGASRDPALNGPPALFEQAKYIAIGSVPNADGLAAIRSEVAENAGVVCVNLTGRAYRITKLRAAAVPAGARPSSEKLLELKE